MKCDRPSDLVYSTNGPAAAAGKAGDGSLVDPQSRHDSLLAERYRSLAARYDVAYRTYSDATLSRAMSLLGDPLPHRIVDLACGTGLLGERILARGEATALTCIDMSEEMLAQARQRFSRVSERQPSTTVRLAAGRADRLPLADRSADAVVIANAFHLIGDQATALGECRRILAPAGLLVIVDWCRDFLAMRALAIGLSLTQRLRRRIVGLTALSALVERAGFVIEHAERFSARPAWGMMGLRARVRSIPAASVA